MYSPRVPACGGKEGIKYGFDMSCHFSYVKAMPEIDRYYLHKKDEEQIVCGELGQETHCLCLWD
ncbi:MAG: hypothetical protein Fur006_65750 [Coleofasciculaceae cyanobacterium]